MKKVLAAALISGLFSIQCFAQNWVQAGFDFGSGVSAWSGVAGKDGNGYMNVNSSMQPFVSSFASNAFGGAGVYVTPWANGQVSSGEGGSGMISFSVRGSGNVYAEHVPANGDAPAFVTTSVNIMKSMSMSARSNGNGSAVVNGGIDVQAGANVFVIVPPPPPATVFPPKG